ncbi:MAG: hypothetical protein M3O34_07505 [Chloroflexota bacterium]|nr:hypothetical protein [Chloroflexota bacterium]
MTTSNRATAGAAVDAQGAPQARNMRLVGHCPMNGRGDGMHINLKDGYAYFAHMGDHGIGTSIVDVRDPTAPRLVSQLPVPSGIHSHKVQIVGHVLLVNYERYKGGNAQGGLKVFDVSRPVDPREIGFLPMTGKGVHRMTYWEEPYAYVTGSEEGWTDQLLMIVDLSDPSRPREVGRWWMPGMHAAGGERLDLPTGRTSKLHHALVRGDRAYCGWWDQGLVILDIADKARPSLVSHLDFGTDVSGATHTACPLPGRDLLVVTDECVDDDCRGIPKQVRMVDIADERNPQVLSLFPVPAEADFCARGGRFGPHNVHEPRPGTLSDPNVVYLTYFNAGVRVVDVTDAAAPREVAYFVPEAPPGRPSIQMNDIVVGSDGLIYVSDRYAGGLYIFELTVSMSSS